MINQLKKLCSKIFWTIYEPLPPELWVRLNGNKKIKEIEELLDYFGKNLSTLEVGSAEGYITRSLALKEVVSHGAAYDKSSLRLNKGRRKADLEGLNGKIQFILGDAKNLPFKDKTYDVVMLLDVLEHIPKKEDVIKSLKEAYRVASKGVIISVPQTVFTKYADMDHIRLLLLHHNSWIYKSQSFQKTLKNLGYNYTKVPHRKGVYLINKNHNS